MIYTEQSILLRLNTKIDLTGATDPVMKYKKPNGETGEWPATIQGQKFVYETSNTDLNSNGIWLLQAYTTIGSMNKLGTIAKLIVERRL